MKTNSGCLEKNQCYCCKIPVGRFADVMRIRGWCVGESRDHCCCETRGQFDATRDRFGGPRGGGDGARRRRRRHGRA